MNSKPKINHQIKASELRVIGPAGENLGILPLSQALKQASEIGLDLIEISPTAKPPVAKIVDYGKFQYRENKKQKSAKAKSHFVEVKNIQIKIGTGEHDLALKARKASQWLKDGQRVRVDLFLPGRAKYLDKNFLRERMERLFQLISTEYKIAETPQKSPKGMTAVIERA